MSKFIRYYISYIFESYFCWIHAQVSFLHFSSFVGCCKPIPLHYLVLPNYFDKLQNQINPESKSIYLSYFLLVRVFFGDFVYNISTFISIASKTLHEWSLLLKVVTLYRLIWDLTLSVPSIVGHSFYFLTRLRCRPKSQKENCE